MGISLLQYFSRQIQIPVASKFTGLPTGMQRASTLYDDTMLLLSHLVFDVFLSVSVAMQFLSSFGYNDRQLYLLLYNSSLLLVVMMDKLYLLL